MQGKASGGLRPFANRGSRGRLSMPTATNQAGVPLSVRRGHHSQIDALLGAQFFWVHCLAEQIARELVNPLHEFHGG